MYYCFVLFIVYVKLPLVIGPIAERERERERERESERERVRERE
jgi:hypothetical protein